MLVLEEISGAGPENGDDSNAEESGEESGESDRCGNHGSCVV